MVLQVPQTGRQVIIDLSFAQLPFEIAQLRPSID